MSAQPARRGYSHLIRRLLLIAVALVVALIVLAVILAVLAGTYGVSHK